MKNNKNLARIEKLIAQGIGLMPENQKYNKMYDKKELKLKERREKTPSISKTGQTIPSKSFVKRGKGRTKQIEKSRSLAERVAKIKATPRPTIPKRPIAPQGPRDNTNNEALNQEVENYNIDQEWAEVRARSFLDDMLIGARGDIDDALFNAVRDLITEEASYETILSVIREFGDDIKDYYKRKAMFSTQGVTMLFEDVYQALSGKAWR